MNIYNSTASVQSKLISVIVHFLVGSFIVCPCLCESLNVFFVMDVYASLMSLHALFCFYCALSNFNTTNLS